MLIRGNHRMARDRDGNGFITITKKEIYDDIKEIKSLLQKMNGKVKVNTWAVRIIVAVLLIIITAMISK